MADADFVVVASKDDLMVAIGTSCPQGDDFRQRVLVSSGLNSPRDFGGGAARRIFFLSVMHADHFGVVCGTKLAGKCFENAEQGGGAPGNIWCVENWNTGGVIFKRSELRVCRRGRSYEKGPPCGRAQRR